ncbi:MAG: hypothetical protein AABX11_02135 [Nanoarchaeota archaeon]
MIQKQKFSAHEQYTKNIESDISPFALFMLRNKAQALLNRILIPDTLISELDEFTKRNNVSQSQEELHSSCPNCLKAHAIKTAIDIGLDADAIIFLQNLLDGKTGHEGYYLDGDELIKI